MGSHVDGLQEKANVRNGSEADIRCALNERPLPRARSIDQNDRHGRIAVEAAELNQCPLLPILGR